MTVVNFPAKNLRDVPACLRELADDIENGGYGQVDSIAIVLRGNTLEVLGFGENGDDKMIGMMLSAGHLRLARWLEEYERDDDSGSAA